MKKFITILCVMTVFCVGGCGNNQENSIANKLKKQGYEQECEDKVCRLTKGYYNFSFMEDSSSDLTFSFSYRDSNFFITYLPGSNVFVISDGDNICTYLKETGTESDCNEDDLEKIDKTLEVYTDELKNIGVSEKELYDYLNDLYNDNFI